MSVPLLVLLMLALATLLDHITGPTVTAAGFYIFPVALAGWRLGAGWGMASAMGAVGLGLALEWNWAAHSTPFEVAATLLLRLVVFTMVCWLSVEVSRQHRTALARGDEIARLYGRLEDEMQAARALQQVLVGPLPRHPAVELGRFQRAARILGGDILSVTLRESDRLSLVVGDASGKGCPAALAGTVMIGLLEEAARRGDPPGTTLSFLNDRLSGCLPDDLYVTLFVGVLNLSTGELCYANAGHEWPLLYHRGGEVETLPCTGLPLGMMEDTVYGEAAVRMGPGDLLFCYTDGATDQRQRNGKRLEIERLRSMVEEGRGLPCAALSQKLGERIIDPGEDPDDDLALLFVRYQGIPRPAS